MCPGRTLGHGLVFCKTCTKLANEGIREDEFFKDSPIVCRCETPQKVNIDQIYRGKY